MGDKSGIQWTEATWNPVTGCDKVSQGCKHCYAETMAARLKAMGQHNYRNGFEVTLQPQMLDLPRRWSKPRVIFVNSMSDLFHKDVPTEYIDNVFQVMRDCPRHTFQVLTKRADRMAEYTQSEGFVIAPNIWLGTSVEGEKVVDRIYRLLAVRAAILFLSVEPLIERIDWETVGKTIAGFGACGISEKLDWVIFGGESGPGARPMDLDWVRGGIKFCREHGAAPFVKQLGAVWAKENGAKQHKGGDIDEWPEDLRVREFPVRDLLAEMAGAAQ